MLDIGRDKWPYYNRTNAEYLNYSLPLLRLDVPLVLFVGEEFVDFVRVQRRGKERITRIVAISLKNLDYYDLLDEVRRVQKAMYEELVVKNDTFYTHPEIFSAEYVVTMASKVGLVKNVVHWNPFASRFFYWIDFGFGRSDEFFPKSRCWSPRNIMSDPGIREKITFMDFNPMEPDVRTIDDVIRNREIVYVTGSFFGGPAHAIIEYHALYRQVFEMLLSRGFTDDDQTIMAACVVMKRELFYLAPTSFQWFYMLHLFH